MSAIPALEVGDLVSYKRGRGLLHCGCGSYDRAVVVSVKPFKLISEEGDMLWSATVEVDNFEKVGVADVVALKNVVNRLANELEMHST